MQYSFDSHNSSTSHFVSNTIMWLPRTLICKWTFMNLFHLRKPRSISQIWSCPSHWLQKSTGQWESSVSRRQRTAMTSLTHGQWTWRSCLILWKRVAIKSTRKPWFTKLPWKFKNYDVTNYWYLSLSLSLQIVFPQCQNKWHCFFSIYFLQGGPNSVGFVDWANWSNIKP